MTPHLTRRDFHRHCAALAASSLLARPAFAADEPFRLNYIVASAMYGKAPLAEILPEVRKTGAEYIEIWAERHGNQREQIDEMGPDAFADLLAKHDVKLGSFTCFKYGIFNMQGEMDLVRRLGGDMVICNTGGPKGLTGDDLKSAVSQFAAKLRPHVEAAEDRGLILGVENHSGSLVSSPESQQMLLDAIPSEHLGIALAPYHLPQDPSLLAGHIRNLGERLVHFQAWEHGMGCMTKLPKEQELMQLPHRGPLDWTPLLEALKQIDYRGRTEIFMHPVPRGIPILESTAAVTDEINDARKYLESRLEAVG
ncbi:Xylose isomerase-like TIM barrel [Maioricimonas rarisocia]|uniref:Xylose isomerase-like TIM barrel n=1 Tax=Maioricimonas rarisocia TaxID=2528026 RepID=A0A517ZFZ5_9PLAN|nr:sugar phosphate isomerase/epimerase [Maioricimonas rarisocia]QDU41359.1 Xylose isomerase-like TIM barrel [Maioricimonas rarisocia]